MKPLFDLSLRYKMPLWGGILIMMTTVAISLVLTRASYDEMREDISINAQVVSRSAEATLLAALRNDDIWHAYETLARLAGITHPANGEGTHPHHLVVVDASQRVVVSARPKVFPMFAELKDISAEYAEVARNLTRNPSPATTTTYEVEVPRGEYIHFAQRLTDTGAALIISYPKVALTDRFTLIATQSGIAGLLILVLLLPFSWYWGRRMALPLVEVAGQIRAISSPHAGDVEPMLYTHKDEVGQLYEAYLWMLQELEAKRTLQDKLVQSERLGAVGQLAAGVAHEINNPLSGMLTAIDTLKEFGQGDFRTMKTVGLIERGLVQIRDIVGALLVQASGKGRPLSRDDLEDIRVLMKLQADRKHVDFAVTFDMPASVPVAATVTRQVMINLLLNALQAVPDYGKVTLQVAALDTQLDIVVCNDGEPIPAERLQGIFEPFVAAHASGHGLGLWVTYQIVTQLGGRIHAESNAVRTCFSVNLPLEMPA